MSTRSVLLVALSATLVAGCATSVEGTPRAAEGEVTRPSAPTTRPSRPTATAPSRPTVSRPTSRPPSTGTVLPKRVGEQAGIDNDESGLLVTFSFDRIQVDPACAKPETKPAAGKRFVGITVSAKTGPKYAGELASLTQQRFTVVGPGGEREDVGRTPETAGCLATDQRLPTIDGPSRTFEGMLVIQTTHPSGTIEYRPDSLEGGGWSWPY